MSNKIKKTVKNNIKTLLETKGFENMEVSFGVKEKSDNLSAAEKKQFGQWEAIQDRESGLINLGDSSVQPVLNKVHKEDKKDADEYYKEVAKKMVRFQKTSESEQSKIGESFEPKKVNRKDNQLEDEDVYDIEALGPGMLALKYDNEGTPVHKRFEERMEDMNGDDLTYKKLRSYSEKYLKHKYEKPSEYHQTPKVRVTTESKSIDKKVVDAKQNGDKSYSVEYNDGTKDIVSVSHNDWDELNKKYGKIKEYSDVLKENIFKVKGEIKSKEQVLKLVDKLPNRVKVNESEFAITDGENYYKLIWEGSTKNGEAIIIREKKTKLVNETIDKMKNLWSFNPSDKTTTNKNIKEGSKDIFFKMMNKIRSK
jgi:hypothetical protein